MKTIFSTLLFAAFVILCGLEVVPKFYQTATSELAQPLFVASTRGEDSEGGEDAVVEKNQEIDYRQLTQDMNTDGA